MASFIPAGANAVETSDVRNSGDVTVTDTQPGTLNSGEFLQNSNGTLTGATVSGAFSNIEVFESSGTFDASNVDLAFVEVVGGGGSGGAYNGAGGGGGGYGAGFIDLSSENSVSVTVGSGGNAVNGYSNGRNGNSSSFGSFITAYGGGGGEGDDGENGGDGGSAVGGDINATGNGGSAWTSSDTGSPPGGSGGGSFYGGGAPSHSSRENNSSTNGQPYGGGGAGNGDNEYNSGDGADGVVIVRY